MTLLNGIRGLFARAIPSSAAVRTSPRPAFFSARHFELPHGLVRELEAVRKRRRPPDSFEHEHDAFRIFGGFSTPGAWTYLTRDGRILRDLDWIDEAGQPLSASRHAVYYAIQLGVGHTGLLALRDLLPRKTKDAVNCEECNGTGSLTLEGKYGNPSVAVVCGYCVGLGWQSATLDLGVSEKWAG